MKQSKDGPTISGQYSTHLFGQSAMSGCILYCVSSLSTGSRPATMGGVLPAVAESRWQPPARKLCSRENRDWW